MDRKRATDRLAPVVAPLVRQLGFSVVELASHATRDALRVHLVIYREGGVDLDDCTAVYKTLLPRIEVSEDRRDIQLTVSSPGLFRTIRSADEFALFGGRTARLLTRESPDWISGRILRSTDETVVIESSGREREFAFSDIIKAQLDSMQEVRD